MTSIYILKKKISLLFKHYSARNGWHLRALSPWEPLSEAGPEAVICNICRWSGHAFFGTAHCEAATCPQCGSIARDRFLFYCFISRTIKNLGCRVLETSPRLGEDYRRAMNTWFDYTCSDFDERAHAGTIRIDLQDIELENESFDVILSPHVLEHLPNPDKALSEIFRVLAPGGRLYLQIPLLQSKTTVPTTPEFHGDATPVHWRFGFDLTERLTNCGFMTTLLCTDPFLRMLESRTDPWPESVSGEFFLNDIIHGAHKTPLMSAADAVTAARLGLLPSYMYFTWECIKPN